jgi:predicted dehydrogenase
MGRAWAQNLASHQACDLVGWADAAAGKAAKAADELELAVTTGEDFLPLAVGLGAEFVVDATPPEAHHGVTVAALGSGLAVLGEKPMASSLDEAREMIAAADRAGRLYMVSQSRRYNPWLEAFREAAQSLGGTGILTADFFLGPHFGGFRDSMASPLLLDMAVHTFDQARFLIGSDPESVLCEEFNPGWSWYAGDAAAFASFTMGGGARFHYRGCWCAEGQDSSWEGDWRAVGPRGVAHWDGHDRVWAEEATSDEGFLRPALRRDFPCDESRPQGIRGSLEDFLRALETGSVPHGHCRDNFKTLAMVFAALESARAGHRVPVPLE